MGWNAFWNGQTTIYVNDRHRNVHYQQVADDISIHLPEAGARVLDFGCGEALSAARLASQCHSLVLCDAASSVRAALGKRFAREPNIEVMAPEDLAGLPDGSFDVIVANSVLQYVQRSKLPGLLTTWRRLSSPQGKLVLGDLIPHDVGAATDATALLRFARANGFFLAACSGLIRTYFSEYRQKRTQFGLLRFSEREMLDLLRSMGFEARRHGDNIGHNPARMTIVAALGDRAQNPMRRSLVATPSPMRRGNPAASESILAQFDANAVT